MLKKCPACLHNVDLPEAETNGCFTCPDCQARFTDNGALVDPVPAANAPLAVPPRNRMLTPAARALQEQERRYLDREEDRKERQEDRDFLREKRDVVRERWQDHREDRQEDKSKNIPAIIGLALVVCALLMVGSALLFASSGSTSMKVYLFFTLFLGFPMGLAGLILNLIGLFTRKVMRELAIIGLVGAAIVVVLLVPLGISVLSK
jgi:hypothetical protein